MKRFAKAMLSVGAIVLLLVVSGRADDLEKMQGRWKGMAIKKEELILVVKKNHVEMITYRDGVPTSTECEIKLDETLNPKTLDFGKKRMFVGKERQEDLNVIDIPSPAIYRFEGDHLDLCMAIFSGRPQFFPADFPAVGCVRFSRVPDDAAKDNKAAAN
jgi:uncharacterized protein (TIGR03067 family)